jgi:hypothetical protein
VVRSLFDVTEFNTLREHAIHQEDPCLSAGLWRFVSAYVLAVPEIKFGATADSFRCLGIFELSLLPEEKSSPNSVVPEVF